MLTPVKLRRGTLVTALLACATPVGLMAQRVSPILDVSASSVRYADSLTLSATSVTPQLRIESTNATVAASGTFSQIASGGWTTQGGLTASRFVPLGGRFHGEVVATAGGSAHQDETRTGQLLGQGRAHFIGSARGAWLGGGVGTTWDGAYPHRLAVMDAGAWVSTGEGTILVAVTPTSLADASGAGLRYTDGAVAGRWVGARAELGASLGARMGDELPSTGASRSTWGSVTATVWLAGPLALTASGGAYPVDYTQGYPGGRFASLALRLARRPASKATSASADQALVAVGSGTAPISQVATFAVGPSADRRHRTITVRARATRSVEVAGDFTGWRPVAMRRGRDGRWVATVPMPAGTHEVALRIDGSPWIAPPGLPAIRDEFGGTSGLLTIRE